MNKYKAMELHNLLMSDKYVREIILGDLTLKDLAMLANTCKQMNKLVKGHDFFSTCKRICMKYPYENNRTLEYQFLTQLSSNAMHFCRFYRMFLLTFNWSKHTSHGDEIFAKICGRGALESIKYFQQKYSSADISRTQYHALQMAFMSNTLDVVKYLTSMAGVMPEWLINACFLNAIEFNKNADVAVWFYQEHPEVTLGVNPIGAESIELVPWLSKTFPHLDVKHEPLDDTFD